MNCVVIVKPRWWLGAYLMTLALFARTFDLEIDADRVSAFVSRYGVKYYLEIDDA